MNEYVFIEIATAEMYLVGPIGAFRSLIDDFLNDNDYFYMGKL